MKIKTLCLIYDLLKKEEEITELSYRNARRLQRDFEDAEERQEGLIMSQKEAADNYMHEYYAARDALEDFEAQEW